MKNKRIELNNLFDCYKSLLTDNEIKCFSDYYVHDLSLSEIATNNRVSKSAVGKTIKIVEIKLLDYESKLSICQNKKLLHTCIGLNDIKEIKNIIKRI